MAVCWFRFFYTPGSHAAAHLPGYEDPGGTITSIHFSKKASDLKREARKAKLKTSTGRITIPGLQNGFAGNKARQFKFSLMIPLGR